MSEDDRRLFIETIAAMRELRGELHEFKEHILGRITRLECNERKRGQVVVSTISVIIAACALFFTLFVRNGR